MWKLVTGTLAALLMSAPEDQAAGKKHDRPGSAPGVTLSFKDLDHDGDGQVTREEFMGAFQKLDRNQDGFLSAGELSSSAKSDPAKKPAKAKSGPRRGKH